MSILPEDEGGSPAAGYLGQGDYDTRHAISDDGSRVFWSSDERGVSPIFVRDIVTQHTLRLDAGAGGEFQAASASGSTALYTEDGTLLECRIGESVGGQMQCAGGPVALGTNVLGTVTGASEDASWAYFVSSASLAEGSVAGAPNLYVHHGTATALVAVLSKNDHPDWSEGAELVQLTARVSPDGRWLAFMSERSVTGYDNRDADSGRPDEEVYLYHAETTPSGVLQPGKLVCASCNPTGARPVGEEGHRASVGAGQGVAAGEAWEDETWLAASVPGWDPFQAHVTAYQPRYLSNSGRLFFNARDPLVTSAGNDNWDVYEYEPEGVGPAGASCALAARGDDEVFEPEHAAEVEGRTVTGGAGCVALISGGESGQESAFLDASEDGDDVFFMTTAQLSREDTDQSYDVYDAHVCSSEAPCVPESASEPPTCETESSCRPAPTPRPDVYGTPASTTFAGPGNQLSPAPAVAQAKPLTRTQKLAKALKRCHKDKHRAKRQRCEKTAHKQYGVSKTAKKATSDRRGK